MHDIEPHFRWRNLYAAEDDVQSPFYGREYSEFEYTQAIYDHLIHPQWDDFGSISLFLKLLYADYNEGFAIIELIGEWNDCLHNDIMFLKRDFAEPLMEAGIFKFIFIGENVLNFHLSDDSYYEEWFDEVSEQEGWIAMINFSEHVSREWDAANIDQYIATGASLSQINWRTLSPVGFYQIVNERIQRRLLGS